VKERSTIEASRPEEVLEILRSTKDNQTVFEAELPVLADAPLEKSHESGYLTVAKMLATSTSHLLRSSPSWDLIRVKQKKEFEAVEAFVNGKEMDDLPDMMHQLICEFKDEDAALDGGALTGDRADLMQMVDEFRDEEQDSASKSLDLIVHGVWRYESLKRWDAYYQKCALMRRSGEVNELATKLDKKGKALQETINEELPLGRRRYLDEKKEKFLLVGVNHKRLLDALENDFGHRVYLSDTVDGMLQSCTMDHGDPDLVDLYSKLDRGGHMHPFLSM
jgi:hypothetical protein